MSIASQPIEPYKPDRAEPNVLDILKETGQSGIGIVALSERKQLKRQHRVARRLEVNLALGKLRRERAQKECRERRHNRKRLESSRSA